VFGFWWLNELALRSREAYDRWLPHDIGDEDRRKEKQKIRVSFCFEKIRYKDQLGSKRDTATIPQQRR